jgi:anthranilate synthase component 2
VATVVRAAGHVPILGVCLGHQAIALAYGGAIRTAHELVHGKTSPIHHDGRGVFANLSNPFEATRYHSLAVDPDALPEPLHACAWAHDGTIMGLRHRDLPIHGVQFHPESILTREGERVLANFLSLATARVGSAP